MSDENDSRDDEPQGGHDVRSWCDSDGVGHRFDDDTWREYGIGSPSLWRATCEADLSNALPDLENEVNCMACIAAGTEQAS